MRRVTIITSKYKFHQNRSSIAIVGRLTKAQTGREESFLDEVIIIGDSLQIMYLGQFQNTDWQDFTDQVGQNP